MELPRMDAKYAYNDYRQWRGDERWELIDGVPYAMAPAPSYVHQRLVTSMSAKLENFLESKPCEAVSSPIDVRFSDADDGDTDTVVQPDVIVVCDASKIRKEGVVGAPDLVVEVLSPSSPGRDMIDKRLLYEREGVAEYWVVSPEEKALYKHVLVNGRYAVEKVTEGEMPSARLEGFELDVGALFASVEGLPR